MNVEEETDPAQALDCVDDINNEFGDKNCPLCHPKAISESRHAGRRVMGVLYTFCNNIPMSGFPPDIGAKMAHSIWAKTQSRLSVDERRELLERHHFYHGTEVSTYVNKIIDIRLAIRTCSEEMAMTTPSERQGAPIFFSAQFSKQVAAIAKKLGEAIHRYANFQRSPFLSDISMMPEIPIEPDDHCFLCHGPLVKDQNSISLYRAVLGYYTRQLSGSMYRPREFGVDIRIILRNNEIQLGKLGFTSAGDFDRMVYSHFVYHDFSPAAALMDFQGLHFRATVLSRVANGKTSGDDSASAAVSVQALICNRRIRDLCPRCFITADGPNFVCSS